MKAFEAYLLVAVGIERTPTLVGINIPPNESDELASAIMSLCSDNLHEVIKNLPRVPRKPGVYKLYGEFFLAETPEEREEFTGEEDDPKDERVIIKSAGWDSVTLEEVSIPPTPSHIVFPNPNI